MVTDETYFKAGIIAKLKPFLFNISLRSEKVAKLIKRIKKDYLWEESDASLPGELPPPLH